MTGFFSAAELPIINSPVLSPRCGECGLFKTCRSPKMEPSGKGRKRILLVAEAPGADEDASSIQFKGKSGQYLEKTLAKAGIDMRRDCYLTNAIICRPPSNDLDKHPLAVSHCRPNLLKTIRELEPDVIIPMGGAAVESLIGLTWKENLSNVRKGGTRKNPAGGISRWAGFRIPDQMFNSWICPTYHPSHVIRSEDRNGRYDPILERLFAEHLAAAAKLEGRPWAKVPDWQKDITVLEDPDHAVNYIEQGFIKNRKPVAFDYETSCLKPDHPRGKIYCCSISDGLCTIAFPWQGRAVKATAAMLTDPAVPKVGANMTFEHKWTLAKVGVRVEGWREDNCLGAHVIFNADKVRLITSVKFQAYVLLGQPDYDSQIKPYLKSKQDGGYALNRIHEVPTRQLLSYCGMDSLLEWKIARRQIEILKAGVY